MLKTCVLKILKHSKHHSFTKYYMQNLLPVHNTELGTLYRMHNGDYYLSPDPDTIVSIPYYAAHSMISMNRFTFWLGPYAFVNEFEHTPEGKYLIKMLEYPRLSAAAKRKVDNILDTYSYWVQVDEQFMEIMSKWK